MKNILLILIYFFTLNVNAQNFIFEDEKENKLISFLENTKIEFFDDKIKLLENDKEYVFEFFNNNGEKLNLNYSNPIKINYYIDTFRIEDLTTYLNVKYGDVVVSLKDKLVFDNIGKNKIFINSEEIKDKNKNKLSLLKNKIELLYSEVEYYEISYSSFIASGNSLCSDSSIDEENNIYFTGHTRTNIGSWLKNSFEAAIKGAQDYFVIKINEYENVIWGTYVGSNGSEGSPFIDSKFGMVWVAGNSNANGFPTTENALQKQYNKSADVTIFKLNYNGKFEYGTYLGGNSYDAAVDIKIDDNKNTWVVGRYHSNDFFYFTDNAEFNKHLGKYDGFLIGFNENDSCIYSTKIGGESDDYVEAICITKNYFILGGYSNSQQLKNLRKEGNSTRYLTGINRETLKTDWSVILKGSENESILNLHSVDFNSDEFYASGYTNMSDLGFGNVYQFDKNKGTDFILKKFKEDGTLLKSTYLGGNDDEGLISPRVFQGGGISNDQYGNIYVTGFTKSFDFPTTDNAFEGNRIAYNDIFVSAFDEKLENLLYSTYIGGNLGDIGRNILNYKDYIYVVGWSNSENFPITEYAFHKNAVTPYTGLFLKLSPQLVFPDTCINTVFKYDGFYDRVGLNLVRDAIIYDSTLRLTKPASYTSGAIWYNTPVDITKSFICKFTFEFSEGDDMQNSDGSAPGADGIAFVIQGQSPNIIGYSAAGIGIENLRNAFAIELDLFKNDIEGYNDPNGNHIAAFGSKGLLKNDHNSEDFISQNIYLDEIKIDKTRYEMEVYYNSDNQNIYVFLNEEYRGKRLVLRISDFYFEDYIDLIGNTSAFVGITAATGQSFQRQELFSFEFCGGDFISSVERESFDNLLYPNPARDFLIINGSYFNYDVKILDLLGNYHNADIQGNMINIANLKSGFYLLEIKTNDKIVYQKFIKE